MIEIFNDALGAALKFLHKECEIRLPYSSQKGRCKMTKRVGYAI